MLRGFCPHHDGLQKNLFDLLQFRADPQSTRLKSNAVTCAFVLRKGQYTWRVLLKLQQIEKFFVELRHVGVLMPIERPYKDISGMFLTFIRL